MDGMLFNQAYEILNKENPALAEMLLNLAKEKARKDGVDMGKLKVQVSFKLQKFDGEFAPDSKPFEVIEGGHNRPTVVRKIS